jgi:hypothetical protein
MFVTAIHFCPCPIFAGKAGAYHSGAPFWTSLLALPANMRHGWKLRVEANTPAYYDMAAITVVKKFKAHGPLESISKSFFVVFNNLEK